MKIIIIICACGLMQASINEISSLLGTPSPHFFFKEKAWDDEWFCNSCGHKNYNWTSICGRCGRSR